MILEYNKYLNLMKEGLIATYNIYQYVNSLDIDLIFIGVKTDINIVNKFIYDISILNNDILTSEQYNLIISYNNKLGYYPSYMWIYNSRNMKNGFKFDYDKLLNKYKKIIIRFESRYEDGLYKNNLNVPSIAFHLSKQKNKDKIKRIGLYTMIRIQINIFYMKLN